MFKSIPTPSRSEFGFGPLTIHFYALCIVAGIAVAIYWGDKRFRARGGGEHVVADVAVVAVPFGILGGRLYHLITSPDAYFGAHGKPVDALKIWQGGLGIWGAIALGTFGAWWQYRRMYRSGREEMLTFAVFADALAPGVLIAQSLGRIGNWFNGELFGRPTKLPWSLNIPLVDRPVGYEDFTTFHPTFLYEALWCVLVAMFIIAIEKRLLAGQTFLFYICAYCVGRFFIESLRIDAAHTIEGLRVNEWVSLLVALGAFLAFRRAGIRVKKNG